MLLAAVACGRDGFVPAIDASRDGSASAAADAALDSWPLDAAGCIGGARREFFAPTGNCYSFYDSARTWADAESVCTTAEPGHHLVWIESEPERVFVAQLANGEIWLGASDLQTEGVFKWTSGAPFSFSLFAGGEPNNLGGSENCLQTYIGNEWNDTNCEEQFRFICKGPPQ